MHKLLMFFALIALFLSAVGCGRSGNDVTMSIQLVDDTSTINCPTFDTPSENDSKWTLGQFQLYLHDLYFVTANQGKYPASISSRGQGQDNTYNENLDVGLLSYFCGDRSQSTPILLLNSEVDPISITGIQFTVGVPFHLNHLNPLTQAPPLNQPDMFWAWQNGYKFVRLELDKGTQRLRYHLGSVGCQSSSPVRPPKTPCKHPNRLTLNLTADEFDITHNQIVLTLNIRTLLSDLDPTKNMSCMSDVGNSVCPILNRNFVHAFRY